MSDLKERFQLGKDRYVNATFTLSAHLTDPPSLLMRGGAQRAFPTRSLGRVSLVHGQTEQTAQLQAMHEPDNGQVVDYWLETARQAGSAITSKEFDRYRVNASQAPEIRWLAFLLQSLWGHPLDLVCFRDTVDLTSDPVQYYQLPAPFLASLTALDDLEFEPINKADTASSTQQQPDGMADERPDRDTASKLAWQFLTEDPTLSLRELARRIGRSQGYVAKLPAWQQAMQDRRKRQPRPKPRASHPVSGKMDQNLEQVNPDTDSTVDDLLDELKADYEPSPLEERQYTVRQRKKP